MLRWNCPAQCLTLDRYSICIKYSLNINWGWIQFNVKLSFPRENKNKNKNKTTAIYFLAGQTKLSHDPHVNFITKVGRMTCRKKRCYTAHRVRKWITNGYLFQIVNWNFLKMFHYDWVHGKILFAFTYFVFWHSTLLVMMS